ncbi:hypothetical protein J6590_090471 [Homalodisca vitripennis]|nr:hypothetical protein J6590_090471 [Homalodisca vitripennis]
MAGVFKGVQVLILAEISLVSFVPCAANLLGANAMGGFIETCSSISQTTEKCQMVDEEGSCDCVYKSLGKIVDALNELKAKKELKNHANELVISYKDDLDKSELELEVESFKCHPFDLGPNIKNATPLELMIYISKADQMHFDHRLLFEPTHHINVADAYLDLVIVSGPQDIHHETTAFKWNLLLLSIMSIDGSHQFVAELKKIYIERMNKTGLSEVPWTVLLTDVWTCE